MNNKSIIILTILGLLGIFGYHFANSPQTTVQETQEPVISAELFRKVELQDEGRVFVSPNPPLDGTTVTVMYDAAKGPLAGEDTEMRIHIWPYNNEQGALHTPMTKEKNLWVYKYDIPVGTDELNFAFAVGPGKWDNNDGKDWSFSTSANNNKMILRVEELNALIKTINQAIAILETNTKKVDILIKSARSSVPYNPTYARQDLSLRDSDFINSVNELNQVINAYNQRSAFLQQNGIPFEKDSPMQEILAAGRSLLQKYESYKQSLTEQRESFDKQLLDFMNEKQELVDKLKGN